MILAIKAAIPKIKKAIDKVKKKCKGKEKKHPEEEEGESLPTETKSPVKEKRHKKHLKQNKAGGALGIFDDFFDDVPSGLQTTDKLKPSLKSAKS